MSNVGRFVDRNPGLRSAGMVTVVAEEGTQKCLQPPVARTQTPPHIQRYRKSSSDGPGVKQTHFGLVDVPLPPPSHIYGKKTYESDHVNEIIRQQNFQGFTEFSNEIKEQRYASARREPLGQTLTRNYAYPATVTQGDFKFGVPTKVSEPAKEVLFPAKGSLENSEKEELMYFKSHGSTQAGQQLRRGYNWHIDPAEHRFGLKDKGAVGGVEDALKPEMAEGTILVKKTVEDFRGTAKDQLGQPRNLGSGKPPVPEGYAFGLKAGTLEWGAGQCITGQPTATTLVPDKDLGQSTRFGFRNQTKPGDESRVFGVPSIRADVTKKSLKSVADHQNYGDEAQAVEILFPDHWLRYGLEKEEFLRPRSKQEIRELLRGAGIDIGTGQFEAVYTKAQIAMQRDDVSLKDWVAAYKFFEEQQLAVPIK